MICETAVFYCLFRELFENSVAPKHQRLAGTDLSQLIELLILKDGELKDTIKVRNLCIWKYCIVCRFRSMPDEITCFKLYLKLIFL